MTAPVQATRPRNYLRDPASTSQPVPKLRLLPRPSDPAQPEFGWERFYQLAHELPPLFMEHWKELALNQDAIPLDPDWDKYYALDISGALQVLTARLPSGQLVGYVFLVVGCPLHYKSTLFGGVDIFYLDPMVRAGWTGVRLIKELIKGAKALKIVHLSMHTKIHFAGNRVTKLLQRLGFVPIETVHAMRLT